MAEAHMPGPWILHGLFDSDVSVEIMSGDLKDEARMVCEISPFLEDWTDEEIANAKLIAAAPDLLAALRKAEKFIADELETRQHSFLPGPDDSESTYLADAESALETVREAIRKAAA